MDTPENLCKLLAKGLKLKALWEKRGEGEQEGKEAESRLGFA